MSYSLFQIGKTFTFNTNAPALLGAIIKNVKLVSITDYDTANKSGNMILQHRKIYPALPPGTPDAPETFIYYHFVTQANTTIVLANVWIDEASIQLVESISFRVLLPGRSLQDEIALRNALNALGWTGYTIEQI
jgi:hypothetical protein